LCSQSFSQVCQFSDSVCNAYDITFNSLTCTSYVSMTTTTCTLLLNTSGLSNLTIKVDLSTSFSGVTCNQPTICSLTGTVLTFNGSQYQWSATNPVVNGTYYIEYIIHSNRLSAYVNSSIKTIDNSEPPIVILPQTITTIVSSNSTVVGSVATLTLTLNASVHIANQTTLSISFPKWDPIGSLPYQDPYSCSNVRNLINLGIKQLIS
jgi:hypothetical protein